MDRSLGNSVTEFFPMLSLMQVAAALQGITIDLKASSQGLINLIIVSPPCSLLMNGQ